MINIPNFNEYAKNTANSAIVSQANNSSNSNVKLSQNISNDTLELSNKKGKHKPLIKAGIFALSMVACLALIRKIDISRAKKEITMLYDSIFEYMEKEATAAGIKFEKPKLVFKKQSKIMGAGYLYANNEIQIDPRKWRQNYYVPKELNKVHMQQIADNLEIPYIFYSDKKGIKDLRKLNSGEKATMLGSVFVHELTHAKQFQTILSMENGQKKIIDKLKEKLPNISQDELIKEFPFIFNYKPKKILKTDQIFEQTGANRFFTYSLDEAVKSFINYSNHKDNPFEYYTNLTEFCAKIAESTYWQKMSLGLISHPDDVSAEFLKYCSTCANATLVFLNKAFNKNNG